jgi:hypothetical protein
MDYYPLLCGAINSLESNTPEARRGVYDRARRVLAGQLPADDPDEPKLRREQLALEEAIRRVEAEIQRGETPGAPVQVQTDAAAPSDRVPATAEKAKADRQRARSRVKRKGTPNISRRIVARIVVATILLAFLAAAYAAVTGIIDIEAFQARLK